MTSSLPFALLRFPAACCAPYPADKRPGGTETHCPAALQHKDDKKKEGKKEGGGAPDKAQRARSFLEAEFDDAVNALKQQVRRSTDRLRIEDIVRLQQASLVRDTGPGLACAFALVAVNAQAGFIQQRACGGSCGVYVSLCYPFTMWQSAGQAPGDAEQGVTPHAGIPAPSPFAGIPSDAQLLESLDPQAMYKEVQKHAAAGAGLCAVLPLCLRSCHFCDGTQSAARRVRGRLAPAPDM